MSVMLGNFTWSSRFRTVNAPKDQFEGQTVFTGILRHSLEMKSQLIFLLFVSLACAKIFLDKKNLDVPVDDTVNSRFKNMKSVPSTWRVAADWKDRCLENGISCGDMVRLYFYLIKMKRSR